MAYLTPICYTPTDIPLRGPGLIKLLVHRKPAIEAPTRVGAMLNLVSHAEARGAVPTRPPPTPFQNAAVTPSTKPLFPAAR